MAKQKIKPIANFIPGKKIHAQINPNAKILIVGEATGGVEETLGYPFAGPAGSLLDKVLTEAGLSRGLASLTNVVLYRPPGNMVEALISESVKTAPANFVPLKGKMVHPCVADGVRELWSTIEILQPTVIIALGGTALWALTGESGIIKWRGSMLTAPALSFPHTIIPTYHPSAVLRQWSWRTALVQDLRRAAKCISGPPAKKAYTFQLFPTAAQAIEKLQSFIADADLRSDDNPLWLSIDIETIRHHLACVGLAWSDTEAICIPIFTKSNYYDLEQELQIIRAFQKVCRHPRIRIIGQNYLYDAQYFARYWAIFRPADFDTMLAQHSVFLELPKALDYLASMYCEHYIYWKDDLKDYKNAPTDDRKFFHYNCEDCCRTYEVAMSLMKTIKALGLEAPAEFQQRMARPVLRAMMRGVRMNHAGRAKSDAQLTAEIEERKAFIFKALGHEINLASPAQLKTLFYEDFSIAPVISRKTGSVSTDDEALTKVGIREPLLLPIVNRIREVRSLSVFRNTFLRAKLDGDNRMRCSYNLAGTDTYRLASSQNAFGSGTNLQNVSKGNEDDPERTADELCLPNLRKDFIPDDGMVFFDMDLDRADLQVVVAEADDEELRIVMDEGLDIHLANARAVFKLPFSFDDLRDPALVKQIKKKYGRYRQLAKSFCHGCVDEQHEALTPEGWKSVAEAMAENMPILVTAVDGSSSHFEVPSSWWSGPCNTEMIHFSGEAVDQFVTFDHRMGYITDAKSEWAITTAKELPKSARLAKSTIYDGCLNHPAPELLCALHADGSIDQHGNVTFHLRKERKINRLRMLLKFYNVCFTETFERFYIPHSEARQFHLVSKNWCMAYLHWSHKTATAYIEEQVHWDGHEGDTGGKWVTSIDPSRAEGCHTLAHLHGYGSQFNFLDRPGRQRLYRWSINARKLWRLSSSKVTIVPGDGITVYCPKTTTGFWLTRRAGKISVTGNTNYGGGARTMAITCGISVNESEQAQKNWFDAHPGIHDWHKRTRHMIDTCGFVENRFGNRRYFFDRTEALLPEALAWVPQSTVALVINRAWERIDIALPEVQILLQTHDSLSGQVPAHRQAELAPKILELSKIVIPYPKPLVIPASANWSANSWGDC